MVLETYYDRSGLPGREINEKAPYQAQEKTGYGRHMEVEKGLGYAKISESE